MDVRLGIRGPITEAQVRQFRSDESEPLPGEYEPFSPQRLF